MGGRPHRAIRGRDWESFCEQTTTGSMSVQFDECKFKIVVLIVRHVL